MRVLRPIVAAPVLLLLALSLALVVTQRWGSDVFVETLRQTRTTPVAANEHLAVGSRATPKEASSPAGNGNGGGGSEGLPIPSPTVRAREPEPAPAPGAAQVQVPSQLGEWPRPVGVSSALHSSLVGM